MYKIVTWMTTATYSKIREVNFISYYNVTSTYDV